MTQTGVTKNSSEPSEYSGGQIYNNVGLCSGYFDARWFTKATHDANYEEWQYPSYNWDRGDKGFGEKLWRAEVAATGGTFHGSGYFTKGGYTCTYRNNLIYRATYGILSAYNSDDPANVAPIWWYNNTLAFVDIAFHNHGEESFYRNNLIYQCGDPQFTMSGAPPANNQYNSWSNAFGGSNNLNVEALTAHFKKVSLPTKVQTAIDEVHTLGDTPTYLTVDDFHNDEFFHLDETYT
jgi:hypothetical protein